MKIVFLHELDTGFMAYTLKPAFEQLGHECIIMQGWNSHLESQDSRVDYLLKDTYDGEAVQEHFKDTDFFILRAGDDLMRGVDVIKHITKYNSCYRLHGYDLTNIGRPYNLRTWRVAWHNNHPQVVTYPDPTFLPHLQTAPVIIERPIDLDIIPRPRREQPPFAITTPTDMNKKGGIYLADVWKTKDIQLRIIAAVSRDEALAAKAKASFFIDNLNHAYKGGPYGMNSVEAWLLKIPVFSTYTDFSATVCPELPDLITHVTLDNVQSTIEAFTEDKKQLRYARDYALRVHSPTTIAKQYLSLARALQDGDQTTTPY